MLEVEAVNRSFGQRQVLRDVSFTVGAGRMTGFVGGNGAGKTTTMRVILGVLAPDSGSVRLGGVPLGAEERRTFGYMPEERGLYPKMRVLEQLVYLARLHGHGQQQAQTNASTLLERLGLGERQNDTIESLSLGNQQRAQIAAALVHDPSVLVLDEPFSGLDPLAVETVMGVLSDYTARGVPVLFSSHQLDIVERLCDDLVVIADGEIRASGPRDELRAQYSHDRYELRTGGDLDWLAAEPGVTIERAQDGHAIFQADPATAQRVLQRATQHGDVHLFAPQRPTLAEIFKEVIQ